MRGKSACLYADEPVCRLSGSDRKFPMLTGQSGTPLLPREMTARTL
jgi:hypothetical protein